MSGHEVLILKTLVRYVTTNITGAIWSAFCELETLIASTTALALNARLGTLFIFLLGLEVMYKNSILILVKHQMLQAVRAKSLNTLRLVLEVRSGWLVEIFPLLLIDLVLLILA